LTNTHGWVDDSNNDDDLGSLYVAGWLKRGPSGIIGTNIADAKDTVTTIVQHAKSSLPKPETGVSLSELLKEWGVTAVDWKAYQNLDAAETSDERKRNPGQPQEKNTSKEEALQVAFEKA
jgi:NADPH-dependent glutamate synthase beta subunit-like oxidoreductase